uniref:Aquaporin-9 n=1 Tax=Ascaris lumbricoides TaxID=6252 RepID=A0A0M3I8P4_ASCLU
MDKLSEKFRIKHELVRAVLGEFVGTAILLLLINSIVAQSVLSRGKVNEMIGLNIGIGLAIAFAVAICAKLSGGHVNPAVSLMFLTFRQLTPIAFVLYVIAQTAGAFFGAAFAYLVYYDAIDDFDRGVRHVVGPKATANIFASYPAAHLGVFNGLVDQIVATAIFCLLIAHFTDKRNSYPSWTQPLLIGASFTLIGTAFGLNCGYPVNPARDLGPRLFTLIIGYGVDVFSYRDFSWFWIPIAGPFIGAIIGAWIYQLTLGIHTPSEQLDIETRKYDVAATHEMKPLTAA